MQGGLGLFIGIHELFKAEVHKHCISMFFFELPVTATAPPYGLQQAKAKGKAKAKAPAALLWLKSHSKKAMLLPRPMGRPPYSLNTTGLGDAMQEDSRWCYNTKQLVRALFIYSQTRKVRSNALMF